MSESELRELEARWRRTQTPQDEAPYLSARSKTPALLVIQAAREALVPWLLG